MRRVGVAKRAGGEAVPFEAVFGGFGGADFGYRQTPNLGELGRHFGEDSWEESGHSSTLAWPAKTRVH